MKLENKILILGDNRVGTYSQAVALAKEAGYQYEILFLKYSFFKFLPNIFFANFLVKLALIILDKNSRKNITSLNYCPQYIISAGRRPAPIAILLKNYFLKKYNLKPKIIQIMRPEMKLQAFDFVIIPEHDKPKKPYPKNLITTIGSLTRVEINKNEPAYQKFTQLLRNLQKPIIALLIGGDNKNKKLSEQTAKNLIIEVINWQKNLDATLIIMNSRRTSRAVNSMITKFVSQNVIFFDYNILEENPYYNILNNSDYFVATGDSVSMISECCSTGKPVYIFSKPEFCSKKHQKFHQILVANKYAKFFTKNIDKIDDKDTPKLEEIKRIIPLIF